MAGRSTHERFESAELLVRLHDTTTGLAIGVGLLKEAGAGSEIPRIRTALEDSLANLRRLTASLDVGCATVARRTDLRDSLTQEARRLGLNLDLKLTGDDAWLPPHQAALLELGGREALRNVRRHAGTQACRVSLELANCPFEMRVRDWGSGLDSGSKAGHGLALLRELAAESGCTLSISSQPGLGTELVLTGPACPRNSERARRPPTRAWV